MSRAPLRYCLGDRDDFVLSVMRLVAAAAPTLPTIVIQEIERDARLIWGGKRPYIAKTRRPDRVERPLGDCSNGQA